MKDISYTLKSSVQINTAPMVVVNIDVNATDAVVDVVLTQVITYTDDPIIPYPEAEPREYVVGWKELDNFETLAETFRSERVDVFQGIVKMLGNVHRNRVLVLGLCAA